MSGTPLKDARDAGIKCVGQTNPDTGKHESVIPTQAMVDHEASNLQSEAEILQEQRGAMVVTPFMFKQALTRSGTKRGQVENIVKNPDTGHPEMDQDIKDGWTDAGVIKRLDPLALYVKWRLGWTDEEADDVFILAETFRDS